jgi:ATP-dependent RNA helicase RhlE
LKDIERLLNVEIKKEVVAGYEPDPRIKAEPITQGRRQSQAPKNRGGRRRSKGKQAQRKGASGARRNRHKSGARQGAPA